jgi:hypothetical protein
MTNQKEKRVSKKAATSRSRGKPNATNAIAATIAKKPVVKEPAKKKAIVKDAMAKKTVEKSVAALATKPNESKALAVQKATIHSKKKKASTLQKTMTKPTPEEHYRMVETAAYFIAEQHGFNGRADEHWAEAEREITARLDSSC